MFNKCGDRFLYIHTILKITYEIIKHNKNKQKGDHATMHFFIRYFMQMIHDCVLKRFHVLFLDLVIDELAVVATSL